MTDQNPAPTTQSTETEPQEESAPKLTRLQEFALKHPRATSIAAATGAIGTALGVGLVVSNLKKNSHRVDAARDHLELAAGEFSEAVSPTSENTDA